MKVELYIIVRHGDLVRVMRMSQLGGRARVPQGRRELPGLHGSSHSCVFTYGVGGPWGGRDVYVKLCWLCGTASHRKLEKGKNLHVWVWEPVVSGLQRRAPILSGCEVGDITTPFLRFTPRPAHSPSHTLS